MIIELLLSVVHLGIGFIKSLQILFYVLFHGSEKAGESLTAINVDGHQYSLQFSQYSARIIRAADTPDSLSCVN